MTASPVDELALNEIERETLNVAMEALDRVFAGEVIAVLALDARGVFIAPKPGLGRNVFHFLQSVDCATEVRIAEENFE